MNKTKSQRNRKLVSQNKRNRIINRRYISTIKTLSKLLVTKLKSSEDISATESTKIEIKNVLSNFYSIIDKAVKKGVLHKNTASRKKSRAHKLFLQLKK